MSGAEETVANIHRDVQTHEPKLPAGTARVSPPAFSLWSIGVGFEGTAADWTDYTFLMIGFIALIFWIGSNSKSMYGDEIHEEILEELKDLQKTDANGKKGEQATDEKSGAKEGDEKYGKNGELRQRKNDDKELSPEMEAAMGGLGMKNKKKS